MLPTIHPGTAEIFEACNSQMMVEVHNYTLAVIENDAPSMVVGQREIFLTIDAQQDLLRLEKELPVVSYEIYGIGELPTKG